MKKNFLMALAVAAITACTKNDEPMPSDLSIVIDTTPPADHATITFACQGFEMQPFTRSLEADGKSMTDLWVLDYPAEATQPSAVIHQTSTDEDFGTPTLNLAVGDHHIYFIASRGRTPTLDTEAHTLTFGTISDTFYKDYPIIIVPTSNGSRSVTLDRCVTRLRLTITDALPDGIASINVTPAAWYYGIDYMTGEPVAATTSQTITTNIPSNYIGQTNVPINIFGFSPSAEWTTDVSINAKAADNTVLGSAIITDAPLIRNRTTDYTGPLFSSSGATTVSLSTEWLDEHTGTW